MRSEESETEASVHRVLVVEDEPPALRLFREAFAEPDDQIEVQAATDSEQALDIFFHRGEDSWKALSAVVVLDLERPKVGSMEIVREILITDALASLPGAVVCQHSDHVTIDECYCRGTNTYIVNDRTQIRRHPSYHQWHEHTS